MLNKSYDEYVAEIEAATKNKGQLTSLSNEFDRDSKDAEDRINEIRQAQRDLEVELTNIIGLNLDIEPIITDLIAKKIGLLELRKPTV